MKIQQQNLIIKNSIHFNVNVDTFTFMCKKGYLDVAKMLHQMKPDIFKIDNAYHYASIYGQMEVVQWLNKIIPMNADDDPFIKAQKRMGEAQYKRKLDAQRRRGRPPTPEEEAADNLRYSVS